MHGPNHIALASLTQAHLVKVEPIKRLALEYLGVAAMETSRAASWMPPALTTWLEG